MKSESEFACNKCGDVDLSSVTVLNPLSINGIRRSRWVIVTLNSDGCSVDEGIEISVC